MSSEGLVLPAVSVPAITVPSDLSDMKVHLTVTDAMASDPAVQDFIARTGAHVTRAHDTYEDIHTSQGSLGAPLSVVLSVAINFVLPGGGALMTAASAVAATLIPRFVNGLMMHGDLAGALRECTNASALKAIVLSLVVPRGGAPAGSIDLVEHFVAAFQNAVARLPFEYALGDGDFRTCVTSSFLGAASDTVTGFVASHIGALSHPSGSSEGGIPVPLSLGLHAANGAAGAAIRGEDPLSGAMGAAMGEAAGMIYHHIRMRGLRRGTEEYDRALSVGANVARMAAAMACIPLDLDADTASRAAGTAAENNALLAVPAATARALAELTDSPLLQEVADQIEAVDAAENRVIIQSLTIGAQGIADGTQAIYDNVLRPVGDAYERGLNVYDDQVRRLSHGVPMNWDVTCAPPINSCEQLRMMARGVNSVNDTFQDHLTRAQTHVQSGVSTLPPIVRPLGARLASHVTVGIDVTKFALETVRLPETGRQLAVDATLCFGVGKVLKTASPFVSPYIGSLMAKLEQKGAARFFLKKEAAPLICEQTIARAIASKTSTPVASLGMHTTADLAASRFAQRETSSVTKYFGKKSTSLEGHAASSGVTSYGPIAGTLTRVGEGAPASSRIASTSAKQAAPKPGPSSSTKAPKAPKDLHPRVQKINNRNPINADKAGEVYPLKSLPKELRQKYPHSVPFTGTGHPDFSRYAIKKVRIKMTGKPVDFTNANRAAGLSETPLGYTWHHNHDRETMLLIPSDIHNAVKHTGGSAMVKGRG